MKNKITKYEIIEAIRLLMLFIGGFLLARGIVG